MEKLQILMLYLQTFKIMTVKDLLKTDSNKVRSNPDLMSFYIETFRATFGYLPNCTGCSFSSDWIKLNSKLNSSDEINSLNLPDNNIKYINMNFKLKNNSVRIISFKKDGVTKRQYSNALTDSFLRDFLTVGSSEEIEERKDLFSILPELEKEQVAPEEAKKIEVEGAEQVVPKVRKKREVKEKPAKEKAAKAKNIIVKEEPILPELEKEQVAPEE